MFFFISWKLKSEDFYGITPGWLYVWDIAEKGELQGFVPLQRILPGYMRVFQQPDRETPPSHEIPFKFFQHTHICLPTGEHSQSHICAEIRDENSLSLLDRHTHLHNNVQMKPSWYVQKAGKPMEKKTDTSPWLHVGGHRRSHVVTSSWPSELME